MLTHVYKLCILIHVDFYEIISPGYHLKRNNWQWKLINKFKNECVFLTELFIFFVNNINVLAPVDLLIVSF